MSVGMEAIMIDSGSTDTDRSDGRQTGPAPRNTRCLDDRIAAVCSGAVSSKSE